MKNILNFRMSLALLLVVAPLGAKAQTTYFNDDFSHGSTVNQPPVSPTPNSTSYQTEIGLANGSASIAANDLTVAFPSTTSVLGEVLGLWTNNVAALAAVGDYISLSVVFINTSNVLCGTDTGNSSILIGMFDSGGVAPNQGNIILNTGTATGGTQGWTGYAARMIWSGTAQVITRPAQTANGTTSQNQDLLFNNASSSQAFNSPGGTVIGSKGSTAVVLTNAEVYTLHLVITLSAGNALTISNAIYGGSGTATTPIFSQAYTTNGTPQPIAFDGMAIGWRNSSSPGQVSRMDISSITVSGQITVNTNPPTIISQPEPVTVASNGACAFSISATGVGVTYQWYRNGTNLLDGGNLSGVTSSQLVIAPAGPADVLSGANGYYCIATATGGYSTNSVTNALAEVAVTNLTWSGGGSVWDLNNSADWLDQNNQTAVFNYGDPVTFTDNGSIRIVTLTGPFLSAASVTFSNNSPYQFASASSGSFAGPGNLLYEGSGQLTINNANTYTGGTIISNAGAYLKLGNYAGLGTGPITLAEAGGEMEIVPSGGDTIRLPGDIIVQDDFTILYDPATNAYGAVFNGNLSGITGKTLTLTNNNDAGITPSRVRIYGASTVYNGNLNLADSKTLWATYQPSGSQIYNGVISGGGALMQKSSSSITYLNGTNTYSGGTYPVTGTIAVGLDSTGPAGAPTSGPLGTGPILLTIDSGTASTGNGGFMASGGARTLGNAIQFPTGTNNLTLVLSGTNNLTFTGPFTLNGNDLITSNIFMVRAVQVTMTNGASTTMAGVISDNTNGVSAGYGLLKSGSGALYLNAINTYTGITTNSNTSTNGIGLLAGSGVISGPVFVQTNSSIGGGPAAAIGTLTISNNLTLNGNVFIRVNKSLSPGQSNNVVFVSGALANIGTGKLMVTNLGSPLVAGDRFVLFNKAMTGGASVTVTGGGPSVTWNNNLVGDGSISVASIVVPKPVITSTMLNGANLILNGTNGTGSAGGTFYVLSSTNVAAPLSSWLYVSTNAFGAGGAFSVTNAIVPGVPNNFYMLKQ